MVSSPAHPAMVSAPCLLGRLCWPLHAWHQTGLVVQTPSVQGRQSLPSKAA